LKRGKSAGAGPGKVGRREVGSREKEGRRKILRGWKKGGGTGEKSKRMPRERKGEKKGPCWREKGHVEGKGAKI